MFPGFALTESFSPYLLLILITLIFYSVAVWYYSFVLALSVTAQFGD